MICPRGVLTCTKGGGGGEFNISHYASLHAILSSFRTHVILSVQQGCVSWTTLESDVFRWCKPLYLCCGDLFTISVLLFQIYLLLSQRECFGCRYWLICRPITRQSTKMLIEAGKQDLCFSASCFDVCWLSSPWIHKRFPRACLEMNICCLCTVSFLLLVWDRGAYCLFNNWHNSSMQWIH